MIVFSLTAGKLGIALTVLEQCVGVGFDSGGDLYLYGRFPLVKRGFLHYLRRPRTKAASVFRI